MPQASNAVAVGTKETFRCCFDCDFFMPSGIADASELKESDWKTGAEDGECRRHPPHLGPMVKTKNDEFRHYGEWPRVMFCEWCGEFCPRKQHEVALTQEERS